MDSQRIGALIKGRRESLGLSQRRLAAMMGVSNSTISRWESGDIRDMRRPNVILLSQRLYISEEALMGLCEDSAQDLELLRARASIDLMLCRMSDPAKLREIARYIKYVSKEG